MTVVGVISILLLLAVNAFVLVPGATGYQQQYLSGVTLDTYAPAITLALGVLALIALLTSRIRAPREAAPPVAEAARPAPAAPDENRAEAEIVSFLAAMQSKGRLVDFLMDDINAYPDAQVGAAARVVHAGCKSVLQDNFQIHPVRTESEGSTVQVPPGYPANEYRLIGKVSGQPPFSGVLVHRGWKTDMVKLPRILRSPADPLPAIAPAEVELK